MFTKVRNTVTCDCKECDSKQVEERTRKSHMKLEQRLVHNIFSFVPSLPENKLNNQAYTAPEIDHGPIAERSSISKKRTKQGSIPFDSNYRPDSANFVPPKRRRQDWLREPEVTQHENLGNDESNRPIDDDIVLNDHKTPVE